MFTRWENLKSRLALGTDDKLRQWGWMPPQRDLFWHYWQMMVEQAAAVIPISLLQILVLAIFFQQAPVDAGLQVMGLIAAIFGLMAFLEGLRVCIMPFAELLGAELPSKVHVVFVLVISFCLGILVTYAEPAISALRPLASLVDPAEAPYLYYMMNQQQEILVLCIGLGVGVAAVIGTLRFMQDWPLKPLIYLTLAPTVACSCYMQWGNPDLAPLLGVAWDCGGVTTGPVTVPILLALGIGVMRSQRQKRLATAAFESSVAANAGQALEGFGIVTLASLFPVLAVELLGIFTSLVHTFDEVKELATEHAAKETEEKAIDKSPLREVIFAIRAIMPLVVALSLLIVLVLRRNLPAVSWGVEPSDDTTSEAGTDATDPSVHRHSALHRASMAVARAADHYYDVEDDSSMEATPRGIDRASTLESNPNDTAHGGRAQGTPDGLAAGDSAQKLDMESGLNGSAVAHGAAGTAPQPGLIKRLWTQYGSLVLAVIVCQGGMILFNIGLTYGFTALGNQTGTTLPASFLSVSYDPESPYFGYAGGLILTIVVLFVLAVLATRAEPALNVLGRTVEKLSGGSFTSAMLIGAVCVGVGVGMVAGSLKILYMLDLIYFLLAKYAVAVVLTVFTEDSITAVAWDSAGVTTGPVTVPFVLAIGIGFSKAVGSAEGFGMLTIMSVAPIISVLASSHLRKPAKQAKRQLSRAARSVNRTLRRNVEGGGKKLKYSQSTMQAAFASDAGASVTPTPENSTRGTRPVDSTSVEAAA